MAKQISEAQIELLKNCWHEGKSIPHCAMVAGVSTATAKQYLADLIQQTVDNKLAISQLSITEFKTYIASEFAEAGADQSALKHLYYQLKDEHKTDYARLTAVREAYESALAQLAKPASLAASASIEAGKVQSIQTTIKSFSSRYGCKIPGRKREVLESWNEFNLYQHLVYHIARNKLAMKHSETMALLESLDSEALLKDWLDEVLKQE